MTHEHRTALTTIIILSLIGALVCVRFTYDFLSLCTAQNLCEALYIALPFESGKVAIPFIFGAYFIVIALVSFFARRRETHHASHVVSFLTMPFVLFSFWFVFVLRPQSFSELPPISYILAGVSMIIFMCGIEILHHTQKKMFLHKKGKSEAPTGSGKRILIVGGGEFGSALYGIFAPEGSIISVWDTDPSRRVKVLTLKDAARGADIVFFCVPSWATRGAVEDVSRYAPATAIFVSCAKGVEVNGGMTMDQVLQEEAAPRGIALLSGPMFAHDLKTGKRASAIIACAENSTYNVLESLFRPTTVSVHLSRDMRGVALCGVLKNIYAISLGIVDGCECGESFKSGMMSRCMEEMMRCVVALGGEVESVLSVAGVGDLLATGSSPLSRNYTVGHTLARSGTCCLHSEGYKSLSAVVDLLEERRVVVPPLLSALYDVTRGSISIKEYIERVSKTY